VKAKGKRKPSGVARVIEVTRKAGGACKRTAREEMGSIKQLIDRVPRALEESSGTGKATDASQFASGAKGTAR